MALNNVQRGNHMTWTNNTGVYVASGSAVAVGSLVGIALVDIPDGSSGELATEEVWELPKVGEEILQGSVVYLDGAGTITTAAADNARAGVAFVHAVADDETVRVKLNI